MATTQSEKRDQGILCTQTAPLNEDIDFQATIQEFTLDSLSFAARWLFKA